MDYGRLEQEVTKAVSSETFLQTAADVLKMAVEKGEYVTYMKSLTVEVLETARLIELGSVMQQGMGNKQYKYSATSKGREVYEEIFD